jgi:SAM-dependent methyltransferase
MLTNSNLTQIKSLFNKIGQDDEFEIMFNNYKSDNKLSIIKFMDALKYLKWRSDVDKLELVSETTLDIGYTTENQNIFRITITGNKAVNDILNLIHQRKNHIIFSILITQFYNDENFSFLEKIKDNKTFIDIDSYDIRFRKSSEKQIDERKLKDLANIPNNDCSKIFYRYKQRMSLKLLTEKDNNIQIDLSIIKFALNPNDLQNANKSFELEIDFMGKPSDKIFNLLIKEIEMLKQVLEGTGKIISKEEQKNILEKYKKLMFGTSLENSTNLYSMQPISAEVPHIIDKIPNKYSATDKADGEKTQLFIFDESIYLISNNLNIKKLDNKIKKFDNTIIEGEVIHLVNKKKYLFMGFDCLYFKGKDVRNETELRTRITYIEETLKELQDKIYINKPYTDTFNMEKQEKHYSEELLKFYKNLNTLIDTAKESSYIFHPKLFIFPTGGSNSEVYLYAYLIWYYCTNSNKVSCPYYLDGIIFTGITQKYTRDKREHKFPIYKFKPPETNSIDIYITFQRNPETGGYLEIYDNSLPIQTGSNSSTDQTYRVVNFYVGDLIGNKEVPTPFMKEENNHEAFFPLIKGEVRDVEGNFIQDNTVVEVIYSNNQNMPHQYRWSILRTRWDKTECVLNTQKKYGNFKDVAIKTWKSMKEAVNIEEIKKLSVQDTYIQQFKQLQLRIDSTVITTDRAQDIYYQSITNLCKPMREFHNWLKSILLYTYCQPFKSTKNSKIHKASILDIGCGRGGDIQKIYHARGGEYTGIDVDYEGLFGATDSAVSRYNFLKSKFPDYGRMTYIYADASLPLISDIQAKKLNNMTQDNKNNIDKYFDGKKKYDILISMFAIHYLFDTNESIKNLINTINTYLNIGGYIVFTLFDATEVLKLLKDKDIFTSYYTDDNGEKLKLFEIIKKFPDTYKDEPGQTIDVMMRWISDVYRPENLVSPKLMIKTMEKAGCRLVDTDLFSNLYQINKEWFANVISHEENPKNKKFYENSSKIYGDLKGADKESKVYSFLNRYYIFQKVS